MNVAVQPHGNRREGQSRAFHPTAKSTLEKIHEGLTDSSSVAKVYRSIMSATGGPTHATNPSVIPRGKRQVTNIKFTRNSTEDAVSALAVNLCQT